MSSRDTSRARRVLPHPPAPVRGRSRVMARSRLTFRNSVSLPTKLLFGAGRLCLPASGGPSGGEARDCPSVGGKRRATISSLRARLEAAGSVPSVLESVSSSRPYCASASPLFPTRAYVPHQGVESHQSCVRLLAGGLLRHNPP